MANYSNYVKSAADEETRKFDTFAHAVTVIQEQHRMIHDGFYFDSSGIAVDIANGANLDILIKLGAGEYSHLTSANISVEGTPCTISFYEGTTVSADGSAVNVRNHNRVNGNDTFNTAIYEGPTVTGVGTLLHTSYIPPNGSGVGNSNGEILQGEDVEWVLGNASSATIYLLRITNNSGGLCDMGYHFNGYEIGYD